MRLALALATTLALGAGCASRDDLQGHDLDPDPSLLDGKYDGACMGFPGGELSGDDLLVLVNKQPEQQLAAGWAPKDLVGLSADRVMPGRFAKLRQGTATALDELIAAAAAEANAVLVVRSGYRSFLEQCVTFSAKVEEHGLEHAKRYSAEPGRSQHQLGTTVDLTSMRLGYVLEDFMADELEGMWLVANAPRFGFALSYPRGEEEATGYAFEPWHYRFIGRDAAAEMTAAGLILEDYLLACAESRAELQCPRPE